MKLTDYVIDFLVKQGIGHVFGLTGGGAIHLFDSVDKNPGIHPIFCHHEQAAAFAAVTYARIKNNLGLAIVTTGPGGTNTLTGVLSAWQDSIPCIYVSGQSRKEHTSHGKQLRQLGTQEFDIVTMVKPITKYATLIEQPERIRYHLEKAVFLAKEGRPGPVWIDIPLNFQWSSVEPDILSGFDPAEIKQYAPSQRSIKKWCKQCFDLLAAVKRPLVLAGYGIRLSHAEEVFRQFLETLQIPFISSWTASDIIPTVHPLYVGRPGIAGQRGGNLAIQNCDLLICLGSHLSIPLTGTLFDAFAREAKIVMVDVDKDELKFKAARIDLSVCCDVKLFLEEMINLGSPPCSADIGSWRDKCRHYKSHNVVPDKWKEQEEYVNGYVFMDFLSDMLDNNDVIVVDGGGTNLYTSFQAFKVKDGQRLTLSSGICAMGTGLPESVGACFAHNTQRTICLSGDGSFQLNIQELQTIVHHKLPIKIFVMNNAGYLAIRHTQNEFLESNYVGSGESGGLTLPDFLKVGAAYGLKTIRINNNRELSEKLQWTLQESGPVLCELMILPKQQLIAQQGFDHNSDGTSSARPLEDMYPYLDREEFLKNMIVKPMDQCLK